MLCNLKLWCISIFFLALIQTSCSFQTSDIVSNSFNPPILEEDISQYYISNLDYLSSRRKDSALKDTVIIEYYDNGSVKSLARYAISKFGKPTELIIGEYILKDENGTTRQKGDFKIGRYVQCCAGGLCAQYYNYKDGLWQYYYDNGQLSAAVNFKPVLAYISTSCEGGDRLYFGKADIGSSIFYDKGGNEVNPTSKMIEEVETVVTADQFYHRSTIVRSDTVRTTSIGKFK